MKVGIIGAMQQEVALLRSRMNNVSVEKRARTEFCMGTLCGLDVVLVAAGVGKVNAASCTQQLIDLFGVTHIIFTGVAGALDRSLELGDIVVSTDCVQHDMDCTALGYPLGMVLDLQVMSFESDKALREIAVRAVAEVAPEVGVIEGRVASGDQFVGDAATKEKIVSVFDAACCEMEGAAVAQVAWLNEIPFVVLRAISDKADGSADADYNNTMEHAANRSAAIVERMVALLA